MTPLWPLAVAGGPIGKRIGWFTSADTGGAAATSFLLRRNADVVDGVYTCCGAGGVDADGSMVLPALNYSRDIRPYRERGIEYWVTFGGTALPLAAWERREEAAAAVERWVLQHNLSGVHNDWESHGDAGVDAFKFYEFWGAVGGRLRPHGRKVGVCVETAPANVSHPWAPRTAGNDTAWHSYMFNWDYPLGLGYMDRVTNMATYPMMHTTDGDNGWCAGFPNGTWCAGGCEDFVDHLTPAFKYVEQVECDPERHTVARWCGLKGAVQNMLDGRRPRLRAAVPGHLDEPLPPLRSLPGGGHRAGLDAAQPPRLPRLPRHGGRALARHVDLQPQPGRPRHLRLVPPGASAVAAPIE